MKTFLGIGFGPIQTGIFLKGAFAGGMERLVIAEVDQKLVDAVRADDGEVTINVAASDHIYQEKFTGVEIYNPQVPGDLEELVKIASTADELATALPGVDFFKFIAPWLNEGFRLNLDKRRFIYTAENDNHAAEKLAALLDKSLTNCHCLNTVVGKMSGIISAADGEARNLAMLSPHAERGHLVEAFDTIYISRAPGIAERSVSGLHEKDDLYPFEEAKLYGHNAIHFLLGILGSERGYSHMSELAQEADLMSTARSAFINESGRALVAKWQGVDELFTSQGFEAYADDLLQRMTNPFLTDAIERITRDLPRKLSWNDRIVGTMRLALSQNVTPTIISRGAALASAALFGEDKEAQRQGLQQLWQDASEFEQQQIMQLILG